MNKNICKNCEFWKKEKEEQVEGVHRCGMVIQMWTASEWTEDDDHMQVKEAFKKNKAFVQDGSDYRANLLTTESFGCSEFSQCI